MASAAAGEETTKAQVHLKTLQMIESCMKLWAAWVSKANHQQGVANFDKGWQALMIFINQAPKVALECEFMWNLLLTVRSTDHKSMCEELTSAFISQRFPKLDERGQHALQAKFVKISLSNTLSLDCSKQQVEEYMRAQVEPFLGPENVTEFPHPLLEELRLLAKLLKPARRVSSPDDVNSLQTALAVLDDPGEDTLLHLLVRFTTHGSPIIQSGRDALASQQAGLTILSALDAFVRDLDALGCRTPTGKITPDGSVEWFDKNFGNDLDGNLSKIKQLDSWYFSLPPADREFLLESKGPIMENFASALYAVSIWLASFAVLSWAQVFDWTNQPAPN